LGTRGSREFGFRGPECLSALLALDSMLVNNTMLGSVLDLVSEDAIDGPYGAGMKDALISGIRLCCCVVAVVLYPLEE
jgi:hypothetical protein